MPSVHSPASPLFLWAHRGASGFAPENTMAAFGLAETLGADGIELDVHLSADGVPVVIHDDKVNRTSNGRGGVGQLSLEQLRRLDAGSWFDARFAGEQIPTLEEVLLWLGGRLRLNVEIKSAAAGEAVLQLLGRYPAIRPLVSSFDHDLLAWLRSRDAALPLGFLTDSRFWRKALARAVACRAESFHPVAKHTSAALVAEARAAGLQVHPFTVDDSATAARLQGWGAAGFFTDRLFPAGSPSR